jgi:hypothetical protein
MKYFFKDKLPTQNNQENKNPHKPMNSIDSGSSSSSVENTSSSKKLNTTNESVHAIVCDADKPEKIPRPSRLNHLDILGRLFPQQKAHVLDLVLRSCNNDLKKTIEHFISLNDAFVIQNQCLKSSNHPTKKIPSSKPDEDKLAFHVRTTGPSRSPSPKRMAYTHQATSNVQHAKMSVPFVPDSIFTASPYAQTSSSSLLLKQPPPPPPPPLQPSTLSVSNFAPASIYNMFPHLFDLNAITRKHIDDIYNNNNNIGNTNFLAQFGPMNTFAAVAMAAANPHTSNMTSQFTNTNKPMTKMQQQHKSRQLNSCSPSSFSNCSSPLNTSAN